MEQSQQPFQPQQQQPFQPNFQPQPQLAFLPGNKMIKVTGIIMIVFGGIALLVSLFALLGSAGLRVMFSSVADADARGVLNAAFTLLTIGSLVSMLMGAIELTTGILGFKNSKTLLAAKKPFLFCCISIALNLIGSILSIAASSQVAHATGLPANTGSSILGIILGNILPILMIIGCVQKNKALNVPQPTSPF